MSYLKYKTFDTNFEIPFPTTPRPRFSKTLKMPFTIRKQKRLFSGQVTCCVVGLCSSYGIFTFMSYVNISISNIQNYLFMSTRNL